MPVRNWIKSVHRSLFRKSELDRDLNDELRSYLDLLTDEKVRAGMDPRQAARQARIELGGVEQVKEQVRNRRLGASLDGLAQDVRHSLRALRKDVWLTIVAISILAIGIGANTALFSTVHAVLVAGVPFPEPDRLVIGLKTLNGVSSGPVSRIDYFDYREHGASFEELAALTTSVQQSTVTGGGDPEVVDVCHATWNLFPALRAIPVEGRTFLPEEEVAGDSSSILISYRFWQRRFGGVDKAVGSSLVLDGLPTTVVGVMPRGFRFLYDVDIWRLADRKGPFDTRRDSHSYWVVGRLKRGVTLERAQAETDATSQALAERYPESNKGKALQLRHLSDHLVQDVRTSLLLLMGTTILVLLIACGNVVALLLARGEGRVAEMAIRSALGAPRTRLLRQVITESALLAMGAGLLGISIASMLQKTLLRLLPMGQLSIEPPTIDKTALAFTLLVSLASGILVGLVPAWRSTSLRSAQQLRSGTRATVGVRGGRLRNGLVVLQVALSMALLVGSGLLIHSMLRLSMVELGFDPERLLTGQIQIQQTDYPTEGERNLFFAKLLEDARALPGVQDAALINRLPILSRWQDWSVWPADQPPPKTPESFSAMARWVSPGYFKTMLLPLLGGRDISSRDVSGHPRVVVVSESVAGALFPAGNALGRSIRIGDWRDFEIVGVVKDARVNTLRGAPDAAMYMAAAQMGDTRLQIAVRTAGDPEPLISPLENLVRREGPNVLFARARTMKSVVDSDLAGFRIIVGSLTLFAVVALALASIGIYGTLAYQARQRQSEFAIRVAFGASSGDLARNMLHRGLILVGIGSAGGLAVVLPGTSALRHLLYETGSLDPLAYFGAAALLVVVAALACYLPTRRATRVDVMAVLRAE